MAGLLRKLFAALVAMALAAGLLTGCNQATKVLPAPEQVGPPQPGGKIVVGLMSDAHSLNPGLGEWGSEGIEVARNLFDTLATYDTKGDVHPFLAKDIRHNADFTRWEVELRPGIKLSNGQPVDAEVVRRNQEHLRQSPVTGQVYRLVAGFSTDGPLTVVVDMKEPYATYPTSLASQVGVVAEPDWLDSNNGDKPVGTGPFMLKEWRPDHRTVMVKNPLYWRADERGVQLPYLDEVEFLPIGDPAARLSALQAGDIEVMHTAEASQVANFAAHQVDGFQIFNDKATETPEVFIQFNSSVAPFDDVDARRAVTYATDSQAIVDKYEAGVYETAVGPFAANSPWNSPNAAKDYPRYDLAKAKELVAKVKAKNGGEFRFSVLCPGTPTSELQDLQQQWAEAGIDATLEGVEQTQMVITALTGKYQSVMWAQFDSVNPTADALWLHSANVRPVGELSLNFAHHKDPRIDRELDRARATDDHNVQVAAYAEVQRLLAEDVPYDFLYHSQLTVIAATNLQGVGEWSLPPNEAGERLPGLTMQQGFHPLAQVWVKR